MYKTSIGIGSKLDIDFKISVDAKNLNLNKLNKLALLGIMFLCLMVLIWEAKGLD